MYDQEDIELVAASRAGDGEAYAALVRRHGKRVYAICLGMLGNVADSEDLAQETFLNGMTRLSSLKNDGRFSGWIAQIARNLCRDFIRNRARRRELASAQGDASEAPEDRDFSDLHAALAELPETYRLPLILFYFDGKDTKKLAEELDLSQAGACTRLSRARKELRARLSKQAGRP